MTRNESYIIGIDPSLRSTGVAVLKYDPDTGTIDCVDNTAIQVPAHDSHPVAVVLRIQAIINRLKGFIETYERDRIPIIGFAVESPSLGSRAGRIAELGALFYYIVDMIVSYKDKVNRLYIITPSTMKKVVTGSGNAQKNVVQERVEELFGTDFPSNDIADAAGLAYTALLFLDMVSGQKQIDVNYDELQETLLKIR